MGSIVFNCRGEVEVVKVKDIDDRPIGLGNISYLIRNGGSTETLIRATCPRYRRILPAPLGRYMLVPLAGCAKSSYVSASRISTLGKLRARLKTQAKAKQKLLKDSYEKVRNILNNASIF